MNRRSLKEEKAYIRRLILSWWDFYYADLFLERLEALDGEDEDRKPDRIALTKAAVLSYCRPFTRNFGEPDTTASLTNDFRSGFTDAEELAHAWIVDLRNTAFAHSDGEVMGLRIAVVENEGEKSLRPVAWNPMEPLTDTFVARLRRMLAKLKERTLAERREAVARIEDSLTVGEEF